jgi:hypothetical protein
MCLLYSCVLKLLEPATAAVRHFIHSVKRTTNYFIWYWYQDPKFRHGSLDKKTETVQFSLCSHSLHPLGPC